MMLSAHFRLCAVLLVPGLLLAWSSTWGQTTSPILPLPARSGTRGPSALVFRPDSKQLFIAEQDENDVAVWDAETGKITAHIPTGGEQPGALAVSPDGHALAVANTFSGSVGIVDVDKQTLRAKVPLLGEPAGVAISGDGRAWVSVSQLDQVAVIDMAQAKVVQRIAVGHCPRVLALTPDGKTLVCANSLGGSLSLIDTTTHRERARVALPAINLRGMAFTSDGGRIWVTGQQPHNELSTIRPETLWSNVLCEVDLGVKGIAGESEAGESKKEKGEREGAKAGLKRMLVLDMPERGAADPCGIALDSKDETAYVALSGAHQVAIVPLTATTATPEAAANAKPIFKSDGGAIDPNLPVFNVGANVQRITVGCNPRPLVRRPHSEDIWVGNHLGNSLAVCSANTTGEAGKTGSPQLVDLGAASPSPNRRQRGRFFFASAHVSHGQFFSCESCHPNMGTDGLSWKFAHVHDGMEARNTKSLRGLLLLSAPYGWGGREEDFEVFVHDEVGGLLKTRKLEHPEVHALWDLVNETPLPPNPYRNADGGMTASALRGKTLFTGQGGCASCHIGQLHGGTKKRENIGTTPKNVTLDVPHLVGAYDSAPYLHDGRAATLEEVFTKCNGEHLHGSVDALTPEQLKDLVEYVREL